MLSKALQYRSAIETFTVDCKNGLRDLELTDTEWTIGEQLAEVLKVTVQFGDPHSQTLMWRCPRQILKDATLYFSRTTPNLAIVIPAMDEIYRCFTSIMSDTSYSTAIRYALHLAKKALNKYYR